MTTELRTLQRRNVEKQGDPNILAFLQTNLKRVASRKRHTHTQTKNTEHGAVDHSEAPNLRERYSPPKEKKWSIICVAKLKAPQSVRRLLTKSGNVYKAKISMAAFSLSPLLRRCIAFGTAPPPWSGFPTSPALRMRRILAFRPL